MVTRWIQAIKDNLGVFESIFLASVCLFVYLLVRGTQVAICDERIDYGWLIIAYLYFFVTQLIIPFVGFFETVVWRLFFSVAGVVFYVSFLFGPVVHSTYHDALVYQRGTAPIQNTYYEALLPTFSTKSHDVRVFRASDDFNSFSVEVPFEVAGEGVVRERFTLRVAEGEREGKWQTYVIENSYDRNRVIDGICSRILTEFAKDSTLSMAFADRVGRAVRIGAYGVGCDVIGVK